MSRFKGIYWRTFTVTVGMVALTLVLLGASFFALTYSYIMTEKRGDLKDKAEIIIAINAADITKNKVRYDLGITYDSDVLRLIRVFTDRGLTVSSVVITHYTEIPPTPAI